MVKSIEQTGQSNRLFEQFHEGRDILTIMLYLTSMAKGSEAGKH